MMATCGECGHPYLKHDPVQGRCHQLEREDIGSSVIETKCECAGYRPADGNSTDSEKGRDS